MLRSENSSSLDTEAKFLCPPSGDVNQVSAGGNDSNDSEVLSPIVQEGNEPNRSWSMFKTFITETIPCAAINVKENVISAFKFIPKYSTIVLKDEDKVDTGSVKSVTSSFVRDEIKDLTVEGKKGEIPKCYKLVDPLVSTHAFLTSLHVHLVDHNVMKEDDQIVLELMPHSFLAYKIYEMILYPSPVNHWALNLFKFVKVLTGGWREMAQNIEHVTYSPMARTFGQILDTCKYFRVFFTFAKPFVYKYDVDLRPLMYRVTPFKPVVIHVMQFTIKYAPDSMDQELVKRRTDDSMPDIQMIPFEGQCITELVLALASRFSGAYDYKLIFGMNSPVDAFIKQWFVMSGLPTLIYDPLNSLINGSKHVWHTVSMYAFIQGNSWMDLFSHPSTIN